GGGGLNVGGGGKHGRGGVVAVERQLRRGILQRRRALSDRGLDQAREQRVGRRDADRLVHRRRLSGHARRQRGFLAPERAASRQSDQQDSSRAETDRIPPTETIHRTSSHSARIGVSAGSRRGATLERTPVRGLEKK